VEPETIEMPASNDVAKLRRYHAEIGALLARIDPGDSPLDRASFHVRRHFPLYALVAIFALIVVLIPTRNDRDTADTASDITPENTDGSFDDTASGGGDELPTDEGDTAAGPSSGGGGGGGQTGSGGGGKEPGVGVVAVQQGKTVGGFDCKPGVRQIPWSVYANPCQGKFTGNNGGATYRGVTAKEIKITIRRFAVDAGDVTDAAARAQGQATRAEGVSIVKKYAGYFNKVFELYGRKVVFDDFTSDVSNGIEEAQSRGEEGACADATEIAETRKSFASVGYTGALTETQPFADCAKERKIFVPFGASYFPEKYFKEWDPYVWHVLQECERISHDVAEYMGKRLWNRNAKWALDPVYKTKKRVFGTYVPDNDGYQRCVNISENDFKSKYGGTIKHRYDYLLDVARFPDQARQAVLQFKQAGVTTLINACDTLSTRFLTESADDLAWGPEWYIIGVATQDTDGAARTFDQAVVDGHLFGMSQLGATALIEGKKGESYTTWTRAFPNQAPPRGYGAVYYRTLALFMMLQAAGPVLTPENIAKGLRAMPEGGGEKGPQGRWSFKGDHTAVDDSREIYWKGSATGFDGGEGAYLETLGGKRFKTGQWPKAEPPVYP
jgi:hypothetical protein